MAFNLYMHERNIYRNQPDFAQIALDFPAFRKYAVPDATGKKVNVDFSNPDALRMVTEILLKKDFNLDVEIPQGYLIPTVPQRLNYILWLEDLLHNMPWKKNMCGIDIGTGPCAIFSVLGARKNNWNFIATETSDDAIQWAKKNIAKNNLQDNITVVKVSPCTTLSEILFSNEESYDFCLCNPPFFGNIEEIRKKHNSKETIADVAQKEEIFFNGGELNFVKNILNDSLIFKDRISLFTSMFGKKRNFLQILKEIKEFKDAKVTTTEFCQGNTIRWGIAWTFSETIQFEQVERKIKPNKAKPPLEYQIPLKNSKDFDIHILLKQVNIFITSLLIPATVTRSSRYFAELELKSDQNTWIHQRRKRREMQRQKKQPGGLKNELSEAMISKTPQLQVTATHSQVIQEPKICASVDRNELKIKRDNGDTFIDLNVSADTEGPLEYCKVNSDNASSSVYENEISGKEETLYCPPFDHDKMDKVHSRLIPNTINFANSQNVSLSNKNKDFVHDNSSISKKIRPNLSLEKKNNISSKECINVSLESSKGDLKERSVLEATNVCTKVESNIENSPTTCQKTLDNKICVPISLSSKNDTEKFQSESQVLLQESSEIEQNNCSSWQSKSKELSLSKNKSKPLTFEDNKCGEIQKVFPVHKSSSSDDSKRSDDSKTPQNKQNEDIGVKTFSACETSELYSREKTESFSSQQGTVLHCHLQLIKGKNKIYVKMNCQPSADRNTMYQVFQLIKNKIK